MACAHPTAPAPDSVVVSAPWASADPVQNPPRRPNAPLPAGVVHYKKPLEPNPAPSAYAAAISYIAGALPPVAFTRATQAALRDAQDENATEDERTKARAAFSLIMGDWGWHRPA